MHVVEAASIEAAGQQRLNFKLKSWRCEYWLANINKNTAMMAASLLVEALLLYEYSRSIIVVIAATLRYYTTAATLRDYVNIRVS